MLLRTHEAAAGVGEAGAALWLRNRGRKGEGRGGEGKLIASFESITSIQWRH